MHLRFTDLRLKFNVVYLDLSPALSRGEGAELLASTWFSYKKLVENSSNPSPSPRERDLGRGGIQRNMPNLTTLD